MIETPRICDRPVAPLVEREALRLDYGPLLSRVIAGRLRDCEATALDRLVKPRLEHLSAPDQLPDIDCAADSIARAIVDGRPLIVVSDFDCDGASGHAVVRLALNDYFGVPKARVHSYIGHRLRDGYGVSETLTDRILREAPTPAIAITIDQGSSDHLRISRLRKGGILTVISDHHGVPEDGAPSDAVACVNPARADSRFGDPYIAGVHVAWLLCCAVRSRLIESGYLSKSAPKLGSLLDLVALGTMADCVDLARSSNNRIVLSKGIDLMNRPGARPVWRALQQAVRGSGRICASTLAFGFGPLINARGRLDCALGSVDLLLSGDMQEAQIMAESLSRQNRERREVQRGMLERATPRAAQQVGEGCAAIAIFDECGHAGVHGICAAKLVEMTGRPVAYFSPRGDGELLSGSLRTTHGFHVRNALRDIAAEMTDSVVAWGGHAGAGGITLRRRAFGAFAQAWNALAADRIARAERGPRILTDGPLGMLPTLETVGQLASLEPFGRQWEQPIFRSRARVASVRSVGDGRHLKLSLLVEGQQFDAIWFDGASGNVAPVQSGEEIQFAFELDANTFRDSTQLQLRVRHAAALTQPTDIAAD